MKYGTAPVKIRKKDESGKVIGSTEVGTANYEIFDSPGEAIAHLGEAKVLELINAQNRTNELNRVRGDNRPGGMSKTAMRNRAIAEMSTEDWQTVAGAGADSPKVLENLLAAKIAAIQAAQPTKAQEEDDDDESGN